MKNAFLKDVLRDIKKSKGRFFSIFAIITLGVAFFSGIKVAPIDMKRTADKYYDDYNFMDLTLYSTLGFNDEDISEIKKVDNVEDVFATYSLDTVTKIGTSEHVIKVMGIPLDTDNYVNKYKLIEGRLPEKENECVLEWSKIENLNLSIGDTIKLESGTNDEISDSLENIEYEIVGKVQTPYYLSYEKGTSNIGNGKVSSYIVIPINNFKIPAYTEVYLTINDSKSYNSYSDEYFDLVEDVQLDLEALGSERASLRYDEILNEANKKLNESKAELNKQKDLGEEKLKEAKKQIETSEKTIENAEAELLRKETDYKLQIIQSENEIALAQYKIDNGKSQLESAKLTLNQEKENAENIIKTANESLLTLENTKNDIDNKINEKKNELKDPNLTQIQKDLIESELNSLYKTRNEINSGITYINEQIKSAKDKITNAENEIYNKESELNNAQALLDENKKKLELGKIEAESQFENVKLELENGKIDLEKGKLEYEESIEKFNKEIASAESKLNNAQNEINSIAEPSWYVLDRNSQYSYVDYKNNADSIDKLAKVFPLFFFLVAALVCLTTMTRMVDEQRINIGTLKGLGYSKYKIASKYIVYSFTASFLGSIFGLIIGYTIFPIVVFDAYGIMYSLPRVELEFNVPIALSITLVSVLVTTLSSVLACYKELLETPSTLMRPKAPKEGKRIFIERIDFIWNKLSFIGKVTVRNIFRYKKRFLMTVFGIAGCTALIVTGFGIKDSIKTIVDKQFGKVFNYDLTINIDKDASNIEKKELEDNLNTLQEIDKFLMISSENGKIKGDNTEKDINIIVPEDISRISEFVNFINRTNKDKYKLNDNGVIISEKAAKQSKVKIGDEVKIKVNNKEYSLKVSGITENYTFNYVYISPKYYKEIFDKEPIYNSIIANTNSLQNESNFSMKLMENSIVKGVSFNTSIRENFDNMIKSLNYVIIVIIVSAGTLAFVVLYNLTNVNISERIREIATIKVLGFYDKEVSAYIYRENIFLTIFGILLGEVLGVFLHRFIMVTVEIDNIMFGRNIDFPSFIFSAILTLIFAILVNSVMYYKLKKVKMVESLKSVD
ncbi:ABC transporter permease [Clostridium sp. Sa3CUN1]|uniref:ABC transporter permease n=1 Tax=Clostridium gallinarum TaxID=2762246 RepID=A0ABR8Q4J5_9CLOT|nr:ABC transporter permease [Clostridium gallinarum]MBD7915349.1 ABC transporter permease [Clostridium gallinarum]